MRRFRQFFLPWALAAAIGAGACARVPLVEPIQAPEARGGREPAREADVYVEGMVCSFCAQGLMRAFKKDPAVAEATASFEEHRVRLFFKPGRDLSEARIRELVENARFEVSRVELRSR